MACVSERISIFGIRKTGKMKRKIAMVRSQGDLRTSNQAGEDFDFWMSKTAIDRLAAVTFLVNQTLKPSQRMDKSLVLKKTRK
jgi:hypothetical protein